MQCVNRACSSRHFGAHPSTLDIGLSAGMLTNMAARCIYDYRVVLRADAFAEIVVLGSA